MLQLVILDVNETLFPLDPVADQLAAIGLEGQVDLWFARILRDGFAAAAAGTLAAFPELARHHLAVLLDSAGIEATDERVTSVIDAFERTEPHPDVEPALRRLAERDVTITTMTNGTVAITEHFLARAGLDRYIAEAYDVSMAGRWKPAFEAYRHVLDQHGVAPDAAALVAVHPWDIHGAARAGLVTGWIDRMATRYPAGFSRPDVRGSSMDEVAVKLLDR